MVGFYQAAVETDPVLTSVLWFALAACTFTLGIRLLMAAGDHHDPYPWVLTGTAGIVHGATAVGWLVADEAFATRWMEPVSATAGIVLVIGAFWILHQKRGAR